jgi:hypothetical protein
MIVMSTWLLSWVAERRIVPVGVLPRATRSRGSSMPWSTLFRIRWTSGSPISSMIALSTRVFSPSRISSISLPVCRERSRTRRGNRSNTTRMGNIRTSITVSWSCAETPATWWTAASSSRPASWERVRASSSSFVR